MSDVDVTFGSVAEHEHFFQLVSMGTPPDLAAFEVQWTPRKLKELMRDPDFKDLLKVAQRMRDDYVERALYEQARKGNMVAIQIVLFNRRAEDFRDVKRIEVHTDHKVEIGFTRATVDAVKELLASVDPTALQIGGAIDTEGRELTA